MRTIEVDLTELKTNQISIDVDEFILDFLYNNKDSYIYISINDQLDNLLVGYSRLVADTDFLALTNNNSNRQLRCLKVNEYAEEQDYITIENINKDYKFFLI